MVSEKSGMPSLPDPIPPALETFTSLDMDDVWTEADMPAVCRYLRGGTSLRIPDSFRDVLPKKFRSFAILWGLFETVFGPLRIQ